MFFVDMRKKLMVKNLYFNILDIRQNNVIWDAAKAGQRPGHPASTPVSPASCQAT